MLFLVPGNALGWLMPAGSIGAAATLMIILIASGRGGFSPHRMLLAGMALSTAFTMLLMMLQASGDPRMAQILTRISGSTYNATGSQVVHTDRDDRTAGDSAAVPPLDDHSAAGRGHRARGWAGADANAYRPAAAGRVPDGDGHHDHWPAQFCRINGAAYRPYDGLPQDFATYRDLALTGGAIPVFADWCGRMVLFPYQIPAGLLSTFIGAPYFIYLLRKQSR